MIYFRKLASLSWKNQIFITKISQHQCVALLSAAFGWTFRWRIKKIKLYKTPIFLTTLMVRHSWIKKKQVLVHTLPAKNELHCIFCYKQYLEIRWGGGVDYLWGTKFEIILVIGQVCRHSIGEPLWVTRSIEITHLDPNFQWVIRSMLRASQGSFKKMF